jgi:acyl-CoA synthetase (AMP-forming)/AMP-acid ligase II
VIEGREILALRARTEAGGGICVGRPLARNTVRVIRIDEAPIEHWSEDLVVAPGVIGEITVAGPTVTRGYFGRDAATRLAKIRDADRLVHRMGDVGYFDDEGRLWYCGRKGQRVIAGEVTLFTETVEGVFNAHSGVRRSALVGVGPMNERMPVVCIELRDRRRRGDWARLESELRELAGQHAVSRGLRVFVPHSGFPVDIRHNAKIDRDRLATWAARRVSYAPFAVAARAQPV